jgi:hypothetical protein
LCRRGDDRRLAARIEFPALAATRELLAQPLVLAPESLVLDLERLQRVGDEDGRHVLFLSNPLLPNDLPAGVQRVLPLTFGLVARCHSHRHRRPHVDDTPSGVNEYFASSVADERIKRPAVAAAPDSLACIVSGHLLPATGRSLGEEFGDLSRKLGIRLVPHRGPLGSGSTTK